MKKCMNLRKFSLGIGKSCLHRCLIRKSERRRDGVFLSGEKRRFYFLTFFGLEKCFDFAFLKVKKCFEFACEANFRKSTIPEYKREYEDIENRCKYKSLW